MTAVERKNKTDFNISFLVQLIQQTETRNVRAVNIAALSDVEFHVNQCML